MVLVYPLVAAFVKGESRRSLPTGSTTFDKSHNPFVFSNSAITAAGKSCLGIRLDIESPKLVGAAKRVVGARARIRLMVDVKIIVDVGQCN